MKVIKKNTSVNLSTGTFTNQVVGEGQVLTLDKLKEVADKVDDIMLEGIPKELIEAWGRETCLVLASCTIVKKIVDGTHIFAGGRCKTGEMFIVKDDKIIHLPPLQISMPDHYTTPVGEPFQRIPLYGF